MKHRIENINMPHILSKRLISISLRRSVVLVISIFLLLILLILVLFIAFNPFKITLKGEDYYALILESSESINESEQFFSSISRAGGSGYIINDGKFNILGAVYKRENDAEIVLERYKEAYKNAHIKRISLKKVKIDKLRNREYDKQLKTILEFPHLLLDDILQLSYDLDTLKSSESEILLSLGQYKSTLEKSREDINKMLSDFPTNANLIKILSFYDLIINNFSYVDSIQGELGSLNHRLKYFSSLILDYYKNLRDNL